MASWCSRKETGHFFAFSAQNGSFSAFWHYKNNERLSRGLDRKWHIPLLVLMLQKVASYWNLLPWWTFRPRKKIFSPPPSPKFPTRRRHPPDPSAHPPLGAPPPPPGFSIKKTDPHPAPPPVLGASDSPFPLPEQRKKKSETSTNLLHKQGIRVAMARNLQKTPSKWPEYARFPG